MEAMVEGDVVASRVRRVREHMAKRGYDAIVVRDEANLRWLTGAEGVFDFTFEFPHAAFITADELFLHTDSRYYNTFAEHLPKGHAWQLDMDLVSIPRWVADRACGCGCRVVAVEDSMQLSFYQGIVRGLEDLSVAVQLPQMHGDLNAMRAVKDEEEIALMRRAQSITDAAFSHMCGYIRPGMTEKQIRSELEGFMFDHGADGLAFASIVAGGPNAANPHAVPSDRPVEKGDFVLMDYGASYHDYRSDMTRTVILGEPTEEQRRVYDIVRRTHEECAAMIAAGVEGKAVHDRSVEIISESGYGDFYGHSLGHGVGLDIHEAPSLGRRSVGALAAGSVVTVEPGIYLPGRFGVRLEDYGLVTEEGFEPFTQSSHDLVVIDC